MPKRKVQKMLSPQEMTMVDNISSLIEQLKSTSMAGGEVEMADAPMMEEEDEMMMQKRYNDKMMKEMVGDPENDMTMKADMGPTANPETRAEDRVEDGTEITEGNYSEVGKALTQIARSLAMLTNQSAKKSVRRPVRKSAMPDVTMSALKEMTDVLKSIADRQQQHDLAMANMLDVMGVSQAVEKTAKSKPPVGDISGQAVLTELLEVMKSISKKEDAQGWGAVQKNGHEQLVSALPHIFSRGGN